MPSQKRYDDKAPGAVAQLWEQGYFKLWITQDQIAVELNKRGKNFPSNTLRMALSRASFLIRRKRGRDAEYIQMKPAISREVDNMESVLFDSMLVKKLGRGFEQDIADLHINFGRSGNCTAFLLRKILEKLIYITFAKKGILHKIEDRNNSGRVVGLDAMITVAVQEKRQDGTPFLAAKTAKNIEGLKFLGDASAHNPLTEVDMKTILPQMPFIITAYKELLR